MKKGLLNSRAFALASAFLLVSFMVNAQTKTAVAGGNWTNPATWSPVGAPAATDAVIINNGINVTVNTVASCASVTINAGANANTLTISGTNSLSVTGALIMNGTTATTGFVTTTLSIGTGSVSCASLSLNPIAANLGSNIRSTGVTISTGTLSVTGNITCSGDVESAGGGSGITFSGAGTINVGGSFMAAPNKGDFTQSTSTLNFNGSGNQTIDVYPYHNLSFNGGGIKTLAGDIFITGDIAVGTGATVRLGTNDLSISVNANRAVTVDGTVEIDGTGALIEGSGSTKTLVIDGGGRLLLSNTSSTFPALNAYTFNTNSTVEYSAAGNQTVTTGLAYSNLTLSGSGNKTLAATVTVNGTLSMQGTAAATGATPTYGAAATLEYKGSAAQNTSNIEFNGTGANPVNLRIDNTNGVTLNAAKSINGTLTLQNGYLTTTTNLLTINANGNATTANGAFVNGSLAKIKNTTTLFTFPVGNLTGGLRTIGVTPQTTTASTYVARFISGNPRSVTNGGNLGAVPMISACEYWDLSRSSGTTAARVTVSWPAAANSCGVGGYVGDVSSLVVAHHNGTNWTNEGQSSNTGSPSAGGTVTSNNYLASFSPFSLGTTDAFQNPLPVLFADVKAYEKNRGVQIEWTNLTERDVVNYVVEHSTNGRDFNSLSTISARGNNNDKEIYSSYDATPFTGVNYYRIKSLELSGKVIYTKVLKVDIGGKQGAFSVYPNPVTGNQLSVSLSVKQGQYTVKVSNNSGQEIYSRRLALQGGSMTQTIDLPTSIKPGIYNIMISGDNYRESKMFIVQ